MTTAIPATRTAVVTGAGTPRGIGGATVRRYARDGWAVAVLDMNLEGAQTIADAAAAEYGVPTLAIACNVADEDAVAAAQAQVAAAVEAGTLPPVEAIANIAGIASPLGVLETTLADWNRVFAVSSTGTFLVTKAFLPAMIERGRGAIVNMSSVTAQHGGGVFSKASYAAAKAAVLGFTRGIARELGPLGITANALAPGAVDTDIRVGTTPEKEQAIIDGVPLGRQASVDDIAALVVFLSGDDSRYITGTTQNINGGAYIA